MSTCSSLRLPSRQYELVLRVPDCQYRTGRSSHDFFRDTAHQHVGHEAAAVRPHDDQVGVGLLSIADDLDVGTAYPACSQHIADPKLFLVFS